MPPAAANADAIVANVVANPPEMKNVTLPANHPVVVKTTFLGFSDAPAAGGIAQKSLSNSQMLRAFGRRCKLSQAPVSAPANPVGILQLALSSQGWTKVLRELVASGLLNKSFSSLESLDVATPSTASRSPTRTTSS